MATTQIELQRQQEYERLHRSPEVRAILLQNLSRLTRDYPMLRVGQLLANALDGYDLFNVEDDKLAQLLDQLSITYSQFRAAGIPKDKL